MQSRWSCCSPKQANGELLDNILYLSWKTFFYLGMMQSQEFIFLHGYGYLKLKYNVGESKHDSMDSEDDKKWMPLLTFSLITCFSMTPRLVVVVCLLLQPLRKSQQSLNPRAILESRSCYQQTHNGLFLTGNCSAYKLLSMNTQWSTFIWEFDYDRNCWRTCQSFSGWHLAGELTSSKSRCITMSLMTDLSPTICMMS